jgi:hypothetical protein
MALLAGGIATFAERGPAPAGAAPATADSLIRPRVGIGPAIAGRSESALRELLGPGQVVHADVYIGEGYCSPGARVFPGSPEEIEIVWSDSTLATPATVTVGEPGSPWRTESGVGVGTTLRELESLAGGPLELMGFGWDYGGGAWWPEEGGELALQLALDPASRDAQIDDPRYGEILGDRLVRSDHPILRAMTVRVEAVSVNLGPRNVEYTCPEL